MALLDIRVLGDPILRQETAPVPEVTDELRRLIDDMFETMHAAKGIGLAAPQVGRSERLTVVDVDDVQYVLINPEIVEREGSAKGEEGCLSIPDVYADVERKEWIRVRAQDVTGKTFELETDGLLAICIQHEMDHLVGKVFVDYLSPLKRSLLLRKLEKQRRHAG